MRLMSGPAARVGGSAASWLLFTFCFTLLWLTSGLVMRLGGSCATGGPYFIETPCPDAVLAFAPLSIFGGMAAVAIGLLFARGFGTPVVVWAWPILFVGLGIDFLLAAFVPGGVANLIVAIVFIVMGLVPLVIVLRVGVARLLIGTTNVHDRAFLDDRGPTPIFRIAGSTDERSAARATPGDWALALAVSLPAIAVGAWLALILFRASTAVPV
jgi:hypothetical protein